MADIAKSFRDGQVQSQAVRDKEKAVAAKRQSVEELKALIAAAQEENSRRRQALTNSTLSIQPLQAEVDMKWAQRNAFTAEQTARLEEIAKEEQLLSEKLSLVNHRIVEVAAKIDSAKADSAHLLPQTATRIAALERQLEIDTAAIGRLSRLVRTDDEAVGERIEAFEASTGGRYLVEIRADNTEMSATTARVAFEGAEGSHGGRGEGSGNYDNTELRQMRPRRSSGMGAQQHGLRTANINIEDFGDQSMMLMSDDAMPKDY